jgi:hypothetical protein
MVIHARVLQRTPPQPGEAMHLSFPTGFPSGGAFVAVLDEVALVGYLGVRRGARCSRASHDPWRLKEFLTFSSGWMVRPPRSFGQARVFRKWVAFVDSALDELIARDPLPLPCDLGRDSWFKVWPFRAECCTT